MNAPTHSPEGYALSENQRRVLSCIVSAGAGNKTIARVTGLPLGTVKQHIRDLLAMWKCQNRTQLALRASRKLPSKENT